MNDYRELVNKAQLYRKLEHSPIVLSVYDAMVDAIEQLVKERDAAVGDLAILRHCMSCKHEKDCFGLTCNPDPNCGFTAEKWEWRGVQE